MLRRTLELQFVLLRLPIHGGHTFICGRQLRFKSLDAFDRCSGVCIYLCDIGLGGTQVLLCLVELFGEFVGVVQGVVELVLLGAQLILLRAPRLPLPLQLVL